MKGLLLMTSYLLTGWTWFEQGWLVWSTTLLQQRNGGRWVCCTVDIVCHMFLYAVKESSAHSTAALTSKQSPLRATRTYLWLPLANFCLTLCAYFAQVIYVEYLPQTACVFWTLYSDYASPICIMLLLSLCDASNASVHYSKCSKHGN